ncbi:hypothetical protein LMH87_011085 [Akanthomyces muscarius]|uniref:Uncharacterized protein n=1 Tax=Akanthomyces muscarius TaxID=2231603 RepID=A0A9W8QAL7_AKAMU|nr:hypothetical protein LMH87_011085 [Akanthomyces muscarius]KAJ4150332.1 hypothetical protein LMH87_011085 [Akanthomyces muscarius]
MRRQSPPTVVPTSLVVLFSSITGARRHHWHHHPWLGTKVKLHPQGSLAPNSIRFGINSPMPLLAQGAPTR